ncbi:hypothetical protein ON010_g9015 [Phytophthora cinnamomi]|nr:hypothetical protein ON010_g9015 [Phytophthora cinnamomi]
MSLRWVRPVYTGACFHRGATSSQITAAPAAAGRAYGGGQPPAAGLGAREVSRVALSDRLGLYAAVLEFPLRLLARDRHCSLLNLALPLRDYRSPAGFVSAASQGLGPGHVDLGPRSHHVSTVRHSPEPIPGWDGPSQCREGMNRSSSGQKEIEALRADSRRSCSRRSCSRTRQPVVPRPSCGERRAARVDPGVAPCDGAGLEDDQEPNHDVHDLQQRRTVLNALQDSAFVDMYELGDHHSRARTPSKACITPRQRGFIEELARENLMPQRIRHALDRKFGIQPAVLPSLRTVQNIVHHFRRTRMGGNDKCKAIAEAVRVAAFSGREAEHDPFTFSIEYDESGVPGVGNGSDNRPFLLQQGHFAAALVALRRMFARVNGQALLVNYVLGEADKAQYNAFTIAKLRERTRGLRSELSAQVYKGVYDLHFSRSEAEFVERKQKMINDWAAHADLASITAYLTTQWLNGTFANWQCHLIPPGYTTNNNPVGQFNRTLKRDYMHHRQLKMGHLIAQLPS